MTKLKEHSRNICFLFSLVLKVDFESKICRLAFYVYVNIIFDADISNDSKNPFGYKQNNAVHKSNFGFEDCVILALYV